MTTNPGMKRDGGKPAGVDPITLQLVRGSLRSARLECELIIERTAMSAFIREKKDYTVSFLDSLGQEIYGETLGSDIMGCVWSHYPPESMHAGDVYWYNDPYISGGSISHTPDMVFITPVFFEGDWWPTATPLPISGTWEGRDRGVLGRPTRRSSMTGRWCRPSGLWTRAS